MNKNIRRYYMFRALCTMNFMVPIFMLFLVDRGLSTFEIFVTQAVYTITELLLTVPSGAVADKIGRKRTLILSTVFYAGGYALYGFAGGFIEVLIAELVFAVSSAAFHGTGEAFVYDTLAEAGQEKKYKKTLGNLFAMESVISGLCAIAGGYIAEVDLGLPFLLTAVPVTLSSIALFMMDEPKRKVDRKSSYAKMLKDSTAYAFKSRTIRSILYYVGITTTVGFIGFMLYQPMLIDHGLSLRALGFAVMGLSAVFALGSKISHIFEKIFAKWNMMLLLSAVRVPLYLLIFLARGPYLLVWAMICSLFNGISSPLVSEWVNKNAKSENRATILSISNMSGCLMFSIASPLIGMYTDVYSAQSAYLLLALLLLAYAIRQTVVILISRN